MIITSYNMMSSGVFFIAHRHNLTHHMRFFANLRDAIRTSDAEYTQYKTLCMSHLPVDASVAR